MRGAQSVFLAGGYANASMDGVAAAAGVAKQTIYRYFPSKEALFVGMMEELCVPLFAVNVLGNLSDYPLAPGLTAFAESFLSIIYAEDTLATHRLAMGEVFRVPEIGRLFFAGGPAVALNLLAKFLAQHRAALAARPSEFIRLAEEFQSALRGYDHFRALLGIAPPPGQKARTATARRVVRAFLDRYAKPVRAER
ncbi:MAG: TetR/AcrR family transcriptional regulator C-terminal domain-containing protein [Rhodospirillaceae bacterium]|nr:TetR/AcrR family transcriptional regulator C-terminal domain-containing protein [Rhodospirillaceae bacterium]